MWRKVPVEVAGSAPETALVDFDREAPAFLEWPEPVEPNGEIVVGDVRLFAGPSSPCGGLYHITLLHAPVRALRAEPEPEATPAEEPASPPEPAKPKRRRKS